MARLQRGSHPDGSPLTRRKWDILSCRKVEGHPTQVSKPMLHTLIVGQLHDLHARRSRHPLKQEGMVASSAIPMGGSLQEKAKFHPTDRKYFSAEILMKKACVTTRGVISGLGQYLQMDRRNSLRLEMLRGV